MTTVVKVGGSLTADPGRLAARLAGIAEGAYGVCIVVPGGGGFADAVRVAQARDGFDDSTAHRRALDAMGRMARLFCALEPRLGITVAPWVEAPVPVPRAGLRMQGPPTRDLILRCPRQRASKEGSRDRAASEGLRQSRRFAPAPQDEVVGGIGPRDGAASAGEIPANPQAGTAGATATVVWDPAVLRAGHPDIPETWDVTSDSLALWLAARVRAGRCVLVKSADAAPGLDPAALARGGLVDAAFPAFAARYAGAIEICGPSGPVAVGRRAAA